MRHVAAFVGVYSDRAPWVVPSLIRLLSASPGGGVSHRRSRLCQGIDRAPRSMAVGLWSGGRALHSYLPRAPEKHRTLEGRELPNPLLLLDWSVESSTARQASTSLVQLHHHTIVRRNLLMQL